LPRKNGCPPFSRFKEPTFRGGKGVIFRHTGGEGKVEKEIETTTLKRVGNKGVREKEIRLSSKKSLSEGKKARPTGKGGGKWEKV